MIRNLFQRVKNISIFSVALLFTLFTNAAVSNYTFSSSTSNYTAISGTVLFASTTSTRWDDGVSSSQTLPFTFAYNNANYTTLFVNTNGYITFGSSGGTTTNYCGLQASPANSIAAYGTDLVGGSLATTANIQVTTRGTAPNRQYVVQWNDCAHWTNATYTDHWNFQIILNETSNTIDIVWGSSTNSSTMGANTCADSPLESGSVGIIGSSNADFNIRSVTNGTNTWATSIAGTAISEVCNMSSTNIPPSGLTYTFTPTPATNMVYTSSTTAFVNNGIGVSRGATNSTIIQLQINTSGTLNPLSITNLNFATTGSTNATNDITNVKVYYTGVSSNFATTTQFGSAILSTASLSFTGNVTLSEGINYFWLTYDISNTASYGDVLKACCNSISGSGISSTSPTISCPTGTQTVYQTGTWTAVAANCPAVSMGHMMLMSDGTVLCKTSAGGGDGYGNQFYRLTPNASGSYVNGTWGAIAPMIDTRLWFSSQILKDGRLYVAGGEYGTGLNNAEVYNPLTNIWTAAPSPGRVSDANSVILENGKVLQALVTGALTATQIYNPATNTFTAGPTARGIHNESSWLKLPDNTILFVDRLTTSSERYNPVTNTWIADANLPVSLYDPYGDETGAAFLLPDGRGFFIGALGHTAFYTPSGTTANGTWAAGPDIPNSNGTPDAGAAMMVNGKIICAVSPIPISTNHFPSPTTFYEFDYATNSFTLISTPSGAASINSGSYTSIFLDLPNGQVLYTQLGTSKYYVYTPSGSQLSIGTPSINANSIKQLSCDSFAISGTLFNGISEGASYGDDAQMNTNFPVIRLTSGSNVYYTRTNNWNSTGVMRGTANDTTYFKLPNGLAAGTYNLVVTSNGYASAPLSFNTQAALSSTLTPTAICSGTLFTYSPTSNRTNATYSWTRAAVVGISNTAITNAQNGNISETLVNTTSNSIAVVYAVTINTGTCSNTQNISVIVKPTSRSITNVTVCSSQLPFSWNGLTFTSAGSQTKSGLVSSVGCDSSATLNLTVRAITSSTTNVTVCGSQLPFSWNGLTFTSAGSQTKSGLVNSVGCDSSATLNLTVKAITSSTTNVSICPSAFPYHWNGLTFNAAGSQTAHLTNSLGCDSAATLNLTVIQVISTYAYDTICSSQLPYTWLGKTFNAAGSQQLFLNNILGCDSVVTLVLAVKQTSSSTTNLSVSSTLLPFNWNGLTFNVAGTQTAHLSNAKGCDSAATLALAVTSSCIPTASTTNVSLCSNELPYNWNGLTITASDTETVYLINAAGCDSLATLIVLVKPSPAITSIINGISNISTASLCSLGSTTRFYNNTPYGTWSSSNPSVASVIGNGLSGYVTANTNGTATITYSVTSTGCVSTSSLLVTIAAITPNAISGTNSICVGATTTLSSTAPVGTVGVWTSSNNRGIISASGVYTGANAGVGEARYTVTNASGCKAFSTYEITVNATPAVPSITYAAGSSNPQAGAPSGSYCANRTFTVVGIPSGGVWSSTGVLNVTTPAGLVTTGAIAGAGTLKYIYTSGSGCSSSRTISGNVFVCAARGVNTVGGQLPTIDGFTMYPNPSKGVINLNVETLVGKGSIVVTDLYSKTVKTQALSMGTNTIDIANLSKGMYFVSMITSEGKITKKLVVE